MTVFRLQVCCSYSNDENKMRGEEKAGFLSPATGFSNSATGDLSRWRERGRTDGGPPRQHRLHYYRAGIHFLKFCRLANIRFDSSVQIWITINQFIYVSFSMLCSSRSAHRAEM